MSKFSQVICFFTLLYFFLSLNLRGRRKKGRERGRKKSTNDKTIIELGYRKISWFVSVSQISLSPTPLPFPLFPYVRYASYYLSTIYSQEGQVRSTRTRNVNFSYNIYFLHGLSDSASFDALIVGLNDLYVKKDKTENQCKNKQAKYQDNFTALSIERKVDQIELRIIPLHQIQDF